MIKSFRNLHLNVFALFAFNLCMGQGNAPVIWHFEAGKITGNEATISVTANVAPGWHLYSQSIREGGPIPTRFRFEPGENYVLAGTTKEEGTATKFYDHTYEMEIIWYTGKVSFSQRLKLNQPATTISGKVEYMTCNVEVCIPGEQEFKIDIKP